MKIKYLPITWQTYCHYARALAEAIILTDPNETQIISIARGGITLGRLLSDYLQLPLANITIQSYKDFVTPGQLKITEHLQIPIENKAILLVDDVSDRGLTFKRATSYLKRFKPTSITTISMFCKTKSSFRPDFFAAITDDWIIFPYEVAETIIHITKTMKQEGASKNNIQEALEKLGYCEQDICFVWRHFFKEACPCSD